MSTNAQSNSLLVPIALDALYLSQPTSVVEEMTNYSRLPYYNAQNLVNRDEPFLSEAVLTPPFQNKNLKLPAGIHLHWSLPEALTIGVAESNDITFPLVPNRWLIMRRGGGKEAKQWIVESDYLYAATTSQADAINILVETANSSNDKPFRYLGRKLTLADFNPVPSSGDYVKALSAIGPFEKVKCLDNEKAAFAGFYPNCRSVFGFHDSEFTVPPTAKLQYNVIGWYSDIQKDFLHKFLTKHPGTSHQDLVGLLEEEHGWKITLPQGSNFPTALLCHASLEFEGKISPQELTLKNPKIAVGNNPEEAIAAFLASELETEAENKVIIEQQLEALQLRDRLAHKKLDFEARFREAVHENGFVGFAKEQLWRIVPETNQIASANALQEQIQEQITLPDEFGAELDKLNHLQRSYDRKLAEVASLREQVFADWYKYAITTIPAKTILKRPTTAKNSDLSYIGAFIKLPPKPEPGRNSSNAYGWQALCQAIKQAGVLKISQNDQEEISGAEATDVDNKPVVSDDVVAAQLAKSLTSMIQALDRFQKSSRAVAVNCSKPAVETHCTLITDRIAGKCLSFDGNADYFKASSLQSIRAISLWVYIPNGQQGKRYLIDVLPRDPEAWFCNDAVGKGWEKMYVNGEEKQIQWSAIPKDEWVFLYLQTSADFHGDMFFMSGNTLSNRLRGNITSVYFHSAPLSVDEIRQTFADKVGLFFPSFLLKLVPGPRYWQPTDPVVLMIGDAVKSTGNLLKSASLNEAGTLDCHLLQEQITWSTFPKAHIQTLQTALDQLASTPGLKNGFHKWTQQPWNPFLMEWSVQFFPPGGKDDYITEVPAPPAPSIGVNRITYQSSIVGNYYELPVNAIDLTPKKDVFNETTQFGKANLYQGASFLSGSAKSFLEEDLVDYLTKYLLPDYYAALSIPTEQQTEDFLSKNFETIKKWYKPRDPVARDPNYTALRSYEKIRKESFSGLAQGLGGFNDALLTFNRVMQLNVRDRPDHYSNGLTNDVQKALDQASILVPDSLLRSPRLYNIFNALRVGSMAITGLKIIDTFGRIKPVVDSQNSNSAQVITSQPLRNPLDSNRVLFPPRLAQPARLNARWLSAAQVKREMNDHPLTSPICGWVLPNNLDSSLTFYDSEGFSLGYLDRLASWQPIPGQPPTEIIAIANPNLRQMVEYLIIRGEDFFNDFLTTINTALETIDPESFAQNQAISLLVGRPLALVRSRLDLELQGLPAVSQNDADFSLDLFCNTFRTTRDFPKIQFPIRVGDYRQFNDGLIGYWVEMEDGTYKDEKFFAPQGCYVKDPLIQTLFSNDTVKSPDTTINLSQTLEPNSALSLAMLIDPRAQVNFTCGILPAKRISLPPEQYLPALQKIEITFLSAPILSAPDQLYLSTPELSGFDWLWLEKAGTEWTSHDLHPFYAQTIFSNRQRIHDGWLKLSQDNSKS